MVIADCSEDSLSRLQYTTLLDLFHVQTLSLVESSMIAVSDISIIVAMVLYQCLLKTSFKETRDMINRLVCPMFCQVLFHLACYLDFLHTKHRYPYKSFCYSHHCACEE